MHSQNPEDVAALISKWGMSLQPHTEGGWYCDTYRNDHRYYQRATNVVGAVTGLALQLEEATATEAKGDLIEALIKEWTLAVNPRVNGGWIAKGWRNGHCYSERRDTLADAVNGVVAQLKAAISGPEPVTPAKTVRAVDKKWRALDAMMESGMSCPLPWHAASAAKASGYIITGDPKGTTTVMCSMTVTGDTVLITAPTPDDMQALTMACYNAEHHASIIIDGKNPPIFARIVTVECKHLDGLNTAECVLTLKHSAAAL